MPVFPKGIREKVNVIDKAGICTRTVDSTFRIKNCYTTSMSYLADLKLTLNIFLSLFKSALEQKKTEKNIDGDFKLCVK